MSRLGMVLYHGIESGPELAEYGRIAEEAGFDSLWVTERYFHEETFSLLGYLAAVTQRLKLGVGVVNPYTRNPALLAMAAATLDRISGGRFLLGLGRSERDVIQDKMGIPYGKAHPTMEGAVSLLNSLLSGERGECNGWSIQACQYQNCRHRRFRKPRFIWPRLARKAYAWPARLPMASCLTPMSPPAISHMRWKKSAKPPPKPAVIHPPLI